MAGTNWEKNKEWKENTHYFTGPEDELDNWKTVIPDSYLEEKSEKDLREMNVLKVVDKENASNLVNCLIEDMGWSLTEDNWHSFIGEVMERTNNKLSGKMVREILREKVNN